MATSSNSRNVELSWAGRGRTGNRQAFEYAQDNEVICRFKEPLLREHVYKVVAKTKCTRIVGMVIRPGGLVDFTLKSKDMALSFAKALN